MREDKMDLRKYIGHRVKIVSISGKVLTGKATGLDLAINDDEMEYDELFLQKDNAISGEIVFPENEIKSIELI